MKKLIIVCILALTTSLVFLVGGVKVYSSWRKSKDELLKFFAFFLLFFGGQQLFFAMGIGPFSREPILSNWFWP